MSDRAEPGEPGPPPGVAALLSLPSDDWAWLLPHVRSALHDLPDAEVTPVVRRLRAAPTSRLAGGRVRAEVAALLARGGSLWRAVDRRLDAAGELPPTLRVLRGGAAEGSQGPQRDGPDDDRSGPRPDAQRAAAAVAARERARERLREVRGERDEAMRRAEGAEARAALLAGEVAALRDRLEARDRELERARSEADAAAVRERRAVERAERRRDAEVAALTEELAALRRREQERQATDRRRGRRRVEPPRAAPGDGEAAQEARGARLVPGRPSRLPEGVHPGTREAVELLLHRGRLVLVDGYNVTKQHQAGLDLLAQRAWLEQRLAALAARRGVHPVVVYDGTGHGGGRAATTARGVEVRFSPAGVTADDEVVFAVHATDAPVVVVSDDRELAARVRAVGADVVGTQPFLWVAR